MQPRKTYGFILAGTILWCGAILLAPSLAAWESAPRLVPSILYRFFAPICHQIDGRSFHVFGFPLAVCSRCSSIYMAFLAGTLLYPFIYDLQRPGMPPRTLLLIVLIPMLFDVGAGILGVHEASLLSRTVTGALFGFLLPLYIIPGAVEGAGQLFSSHFQKGTSDA